MEVTGGPNGVFDYNTYAFLSLDPWINKIEQYYLNLGFLVTVGFFLHYVGNRTETGKAFKAIREEELLAGTLGINTIAYKMIAFCISSSVAGLAGGLYAYYIRIVSPSTATAYITQLAIAMTILGGMGTIWGPVFGAIIMYIVYEYMRFVGVIYNVIAVSLVIMLAVMFFPRGLAGLIIDFMHSRTLGKHRYRNAEHPPGQIPRPKQNEVSIN
jgi:branched-chain amino acid transport system permease protein